MKEVLTKEVKKVDSFGRTLIVSMNSSESLRSLWVRPPSKDWQLLLPAPDTITVGAGGEGTRVLLLKGVDAAGNTQRSASNFTWFVPLSCGVTFPGSRGNNAGSAPFLTRNSTMWFTLNGSTYVGSYLVSLDNATFQSVRSSVYVGNTSGDGVHSLQIRGVDKTGVADVSVCSRVIWLVDATPPVCKICHLCILIIFSYILESGSGYTCHWLAHTQHLLDAAT